MQPVQNKKQTENSHFLCFSVIRPLTESCIYVDHNSFLFQTLKFITSDEQKR